MQIWNMKMKMAVIKVIYEAPQSHLWRRHDSLVSFMCGRPSCAWRASLPAPASLCRDGVRRRHRRLLLTVCVWLIAPSRTLCATVIYIFNKIGTRWLPPLSQTIYWTLGPNRQPHHPSTTIDPSFHIYNPKLLLFNRKGATATTPVSTTKYICTEEWQLFTKA